MNKRVFGRQEMIHINDKIANLILVKNPVGLNEIIELIQREKEPFTLVTILNANYADGIDTSWIWDGDYEKNLLTKTLSKSLLADIVIKTWLLDYKWLICHLTKQRLYLTFQTYLNPSKKHLLKKTYILSTYTGVLEFRKYLSDKGIIKAGLN